MNARQPAVLIGIFILALIVSIGWFLLSPKKNNPSNTNTQATSSSSSSQTKISNLTNLDPADFDSLVKTEYALATEKAEAQNPANKLTGIQIKINADMDPESVETIYVFTSAVNDVNNWVITLAGQNQNYVRALIPKEDFFGNADPINTELWKYNFVTALQLAEKNGGSTWREQNTLLGIVLTLKHTGTNNWLLWTVSYTGEKENYTIQLDANSGKKIES